MSQSIEQILRISDATEQLNSFASFLDQTIVKSNGNPSLLINLFQKLVSDDVPIQTGKTFLVQIATKMKALTEEAYEEVSNAVLSSLRTSTGVYDETDYIIRDHLFGIYVSWGQFSDAAQTLSGFNVESTTKVLNDQEKADLYIKCAEAFLEDEASVDAEVFVNKASPFINAVVDTTIILRYRATFARVMDSNRKFVEAALRYYELSTTNHPGILQDDLLELLGKAVTCAILGKTGPPRTRVIGLLQNDDRITTLDQNPKYASHSIILTKVHKEQIIRREELKVFEASLQDHQKATTADGFTILEKAIIEHNMLATGKMYLNIHLSELSNILLIDERRAEKVAATMITEGRLRASIDQIERLLIFQGDSDAIAKLNGQITEICEDVQNFVNAIQ